MRLEPLLDCVVIEPITKSGRIHLPDTANGGGLKRGLIVAVGNGVSKLKLGDEVFYAVRARGATAELVHFDGKDFVVCPAEAVVARVRPDDEPLTFNDLQRGTTAELSAKVPPPNDGPPPGSILRVPPSTAPLCYICEEPIWAGDHVGIRDKVMVHAECEAPRGA